jgi:hypothetical protein
VFQHLGAKYEVEPILAESVDELAHVADHIDAVPGSDVHAQILSRAVALNQRPG